MVWEVAAFHPERLHLVPDACGTFPSKSKSTGSENRAALLSPLMPVVVARLATVVSTAAVTSSSSEA